MKIIALPALVGSYDNYIWILHNQTSAWVVDPGESAQVIEYLKSQKLQLKAILITHNHFDHVDGIVDIKQHFPLAQVYGPEKTTHPAIQIKLTEGDTINLATDLSFKIMETPGHTLDHISYYNDQWLFCGDTLFTAGCGRQLGGGYKNFANSILKIRDLPDHLGFYCAHEYTQSNLKFALLVEPNNSALQDRYQQCEISYPKVLQEAPSTLGIEKHTNPFLRFDEPNISSQLVKRGNNNHSSASLFKALRDWKDYIDKHGLPS